MTTFPQQFVANRDAIYMHTSKRYRLKREMNFSSLSRDISSFWNVTKLAISYFMPQQPHWCIESYIFSNALAEFSVSLMNEKNENYEKREREKNGSMRLYRFLSMTHETLKKWFPNIHEMWTQKKRKASRETLDLEICYFFSSLQRLWWLIFFRVLFWRKYKRLSGSYIVKYTQC